MIISRLLQCCIVIVMQIKLIVVVVVAVESYEELLGRAKLRTLYNRRLQDTAVLMYKVKYGLTPTCISDLFARKNSTHALRNCDFAVTRYDTIGYGKHY